MEAFGASVTASPSTETESGRAILAAHPDSNGSLGIAISEAVEVAAKDPFSGACRQVPLDIFDSSEVVFDELGIAEDFWRLLHDDAWRVGVH